MSNEQMKELNTTYFRNVIDLETSSLQGFANTWVKEKKNTDLPEDIIGDIDVATGQAELLIQERFTQFKSLIDDCELKRSEKEVTLQDLEGFWAIIFIQVQGIKLKFTKLAELKECNWEQKPANSLNCLKRKPLVIKNNILIKKKNQSHGSSSIREYILAARKKLQKEDNLNLTNVENLESLKIDEATTNKENEVQVKTCSKTLNETKQFDAGFFKVQTPIKQSSSNRKDNIMSSASTPKLLSSTALRRQLEVSPLQHKDYFPCMRITRSMKKGFIV